MSKQKLLASAGLMLGLTITMAQADCPFYYQAVPRNVVAITSSTGELSAQSGHAL